MIFVIGMWIYLLTMFFDSENEGVQSIIELTAIIGVVTMCVSVSMFLWGKCHEKYQWTHPAASTSGCV